MEKFKDFIYEQSDLFFTGLIVVVVGIIITSNLYGWFDIKDKENKYTEINEVIQEEQSSSASSADSAKNDENKDSKNEDNNSSLAGPDNTSSKETTKNDDAKEIPLSEEDTKSDAVKKDIRNVDIAPGSSSSSIAKSLENQGLVKSSSEFLNLLVSSGKETKLKAGKFSITEGSTDQQIIDALTR